MKKKLKKLKIKFAAWRRWCDLCDKNILYKLLVLFNIKESHLFARLYCLELMKSELNETFEILFKK